MARGLLAKIPGLGYPDAGKRHRAINLTCREPIIRVSPLGMFATARISLKSLAQLCRRLAISFDAGIDARKVWRREASEGPRGQRQRLAMVLESVEKGGTVTEGLEQTGKYFPDLFREMVAVGEATGSLPRVLSRLADHYDHRVKMLRTFRTAMIWPLTQLSIAILVVGLLIWIMGIIAQRRGGEPIDLVGLGLVGNTGVAIYASIVAGLIALLVLTVWSAKRGWLWGRALQRLTLKIPVIGGCLETLALARIAWTLHLTMNVEMDLRQVLPLVMRSTGNDYYSRYSQQVVEDVVAGNKIHEALRRTRTLPADFLAAVEVAEHSGMMVESMGRLSRQYEDLARSAMAKLNVIAGFTVWVMVASLIILMIFRLAMFYINTINEALNF